MDASPLFDPEYLPIILGTLIGFGILAALLLVPVSRFLDREQEVAEEWTPEMIAERLQQRKPTATNGSNADDESGPQGAEEDGPNTSEPT